MSNPRGGETWVVIPARFASSRFPGKPLVSVLGVPLVRRVAEAAVAAHVADQVLVATDDRRVVDAMAGIEARVVFDAQPFRSGSDRVAGVALPEDVSVVINLQGDEALVDAEILRCAVEGLADGDVGTVATRVGLDFAWPDPNAVKVRHDLDGRALDFFRLAGTASPPVDGSVALHIGVYAYRAASLRRFANLPMSLRERREGLEQLRALEAGMRIGLRFVTSPAASINSPSDMTRVERLLAVWKSGAGDEGREKVR